GLDSATAVNRAAGVGAFQVGGVVRAIGVLIFQPIELILVEGLVPRTLNQPPARRVVMRRREREARAAADAVNRLHQRLPERRLADDVGAIVVLQGAGDNLRRAGAVAVRDYDDGNVRELA